MTPQQELALRRELGQAMLRLVTWLGENRMDGWDEVMRRVETERYRQAVAKAARHGIENSLAWHTLGVWTEEGKERIGCFSRALACVRAEAATQPASNPHTAWTHAHMETDSLYEIARVHAHEGAPDAARRFLEEALPIARRADSMRVAAKLKDTQDIEGKVAALLLQLPDESDA